MNNDKEKKEQTGSDFARDDNLKSFTEEKTGEKREGDDKDPLEKEVGGFKQEKQNEEHEVEEEGIDNFKGIIERLEKEKEDLYSRLQRLQADFDNYRKRVKAERQEIRDQALLELTEKLLPVLDNLERAVYYTQEETSEESLYEGVIMVYRQFQEALAKEGIVPIECKGEPFDPCFHEAVDQQEVEGVPSQTIVEELQKGYKLKDKVIRASMVRVSK